ncbi:MAG: hypothetical protein KDD48_03440 [Bdellovibrionales bacterium]|nr:hypothetical protein [Bdellovibrionales bacterium]
MIQKRIRKNRKGFGFTLIELVFAMFIMALIARVSIPKINSVFRINLKTGATRVAAYFRAAYERSVMRHERIRVSFDAEKSQLFAEQFMNSPVEPLWNGDTDIDDAIAKIEKRLEDERSGKSLPSQFERLESEDLQPETLPKGVRIKGVYLLKDDKLVTDQLSYIDFNPNGFTSPAIIYVTNDTEDVYSVVLSAIGGKVRIEKGEVQPGDA